MLSIPEVYFTLGYVPATLLLCCSCAGSWLTTQILVQECVRADAQVKEQVLRDGVLIGKLNLNVNIYYSEN